MEEESFSASVAKLASLLNITFGPHGRAALVAESSPRQLSLTRSGPQLINLFKGCHPLLDVILKDVEEAREFLGEGSKRCLLAIIGLLPLLGERRQAISELGKAVRLWEEWLAQGKASESGDMDISEEQVDAVVLTSLKSSFPLNVATQLASLLSNHIKQVTKASNASCLISEVANLSRELPNSLVQLHRASLASSFTGEGTLLQAGLSKPTSVLSHTKGEGVRVRLVILAEEEPEEAIFSLEEGGMGAVSTAAWERVGRNVDLLVREKVQLLVFGRGLPEYWKQRLALQDIGVVERAGNEEVVSLGRALRVTPWSPGTKPTSASIATAKVKSIELGEQLALCLEPETISVHHLVIAAPTPQLAAAYSKALQAALRCAALLTDCRLRGKMGVRLTMETIGIEKGSQVLIQLARTGLWGCQGESGAEPACLEERLVACVLSTLQRVARVEVVVPCRRIGGLATFRRARRVGRGDESDED